MDLITQASQLAAAGASGTTEEATDDNFNQTVLLLHGDGSEGQGTSTSLGDPNYKAFRDNSTSAHAIAVEADSYGTDFSPYYYADGYWSNYFDGGDDKITIPYSPDHQLGTEPFTLEFWLYLKATGTNGFIGNYNGWYFQIWVNELELAQGASAAIERAWSPNVGQWYHIAVTRDNSSVGRIFVDGTQLGADQANMTTDFVTGSNALEIGNCGPQLGRYFQGGYISNLRIIKGRGLYTSNFTRPSAPFTDPTTSGELSVYFDGTGDELIIPDSSDFTFGSNNFSIGVWVYRLDSSSSTERAIGNTGGTSYTSWLLTTKKFWATSTSNSWNIQVNFSQDVPVKRWVYVQVNRVGNVYTAYHDGVSVGTVTVSGSLYDNSSDFEIGKRQGASSMYGYMSNFIMTNNGNLASTDVPTSPSTAVTNTKLLTLQSKNFTDESDSSHSITVNGNTRLSEFGPFGDGYWSNDFDGTSDSLTITSTAALQLPDEFTIEFFMKLDTVVVDAQHPSPITFPSNGSHITQVYVQASNGYVGLYYNGDIVKSSNGSIVANKWYHVAVGRDSSDQIALWLDGVRVATATNGFSVGNSSGTFRVGSYSGTGGDVNGKISNLRIVKGSDVYGYSNATITVPTSPLTKISGTSLLTCQSNRFIDNSDSGYSLTVNGNTSIDELIPFEYLQRQTKLITCQGHRFKDVIPFRHHSMTTTNVVKASTYIPFTATKVDNVGSGHFDGSGDFVSVADSTDFTLGNSDFTVECWVYFKTVSGTQYVYGQSHSSAASATAIQMYSSGTTLYGWTGFGSVSGTINANEWIHVAFVRQSTNLRLYLNGEQTGTAAAGTNSVTDSSGIFALGRVGAYASNYFNGYISDFNLIKGTCKYENGVAFTPPTSTITAHTNTKLLTCQYSGAVRNMGFLDDSNSNFEIIRSGDVSPGTFTPFSLEDGYWSWYFDGNHPVEIADSGSGLDLPGDFTVEFWAYEPKIATTNGYTNLFFTVDTLDRFQFGNNGTNVFFYNGGLVISTTPSTLNQWNHYALVREGSSTNNLSCYRNGTRLAQATNNTNYTANSLMLGGQDRGSTTGYHGCFMYMSNFRIVKGTAVYSGSSYTVPTEPLTAISGTSLLACQSNRYVDNGPNSMTITTASNAPNRVKAFSPFAPSRSYTKDAVGGSALFDSSGDGLKVVDSDGPLGTSDFEVELWYYPTTISGSKYIFNTSYNNGSFGPILIYMANNDLTVRLYSSSSGSSWNVFGYKTLGTVKLHQWNHIYLSRVSNAMYAFVDGTASSQNGDAWSTNYTLTNAPVYIGTYDTSGSLPATGHISNVQFNLGSGSTTKTIPTAPNTPNSYTYVQTNFTNAGIIDHTMKHNLETQGNVRVRTDVKKYGTGSIYFDGASDELIQKASHLTMNFGTGQFTIEFWVLIPSGASTGNYQMFMSTEGSSWSGGAISWYTHYTGGSHLFPMFVADYSGGSPMLSAGSTNLADGAWHHHAVVRGASGACAYFLDGTRKSTVTFTGNVGSATRDAYFGSMGTGSRNAEMYLDDLRVTMGIARYDPTQTSVTIPTESFANR